MRSLWIDASGGVFGRGRDPDHEPGDARSDSTMCGGHSCRCAARDRRPSRGPPVAADAALERGQLLHATADALRANRAELSKLSPRRGKPRIENLDEVEWSAACFQYYAEIDVMPTGR